MRGFIVFIVTAALGSAACAQNTPHPRSATHQTAAPAAQTAAEPNDMSAVPRDVQKWFGGAVDDMLTGADKAVDPGGNKR